MVNSALKDNSTGIEVNYIVKMSLLILLLLYLFYFVTFLYRHICKNYNKSFNEKKKKYISFKCRMHGNVLCHLTTDQDTFLWEVQSGRFLSYLKKLYHKLAREVYVFQLELCINLREK